MSEVERYDFNRNQHKNMIEQYRFKQEIQTFKKTLAPNPNQVQYLEESKQKIRKQILDTANKTGNSRERCLLTAICGELTLHSNKRQQAEFATRLLLLDLLTE